MGTILIVGAGRLGIAVAARSRAAGKRVLAMRRTHHSMPDAVELVLADVTGPNAFACIKEPLQEVIYCVSPDGRTTIDYERSFVLGLSHLLTWLEATQQTPRLLFVSSTAVYAQIDGAWVDEESETAPLAAGPRVLLAAERMALSLGNQGIVLRLAGLYGPHSSGLIERAAQGVMPRFPGNRYVNRIHLADAAAAVDHLLQLAQPAPMYLGVDDAPAPQEAILAWLSEEFDLPLPVFSSPPAHSPEPNKRCSNARLKRSGFSFQYPTFREGYAELARNAGLVQRRICAP